MHDRWYRFLRKNLKSTRKERNHPPFFFSTFLRSLRSFAAIPSNLKLPLGLFRSAMLLHFLDHAAQLVIIENRRDRVAHLLHRNAQPARLLVGTRARLISRLTHTRNRRERPVE